jgi:hypothetical protein
MPSRYSRTFVYPRPLALGTVAAERVKDGLARLARSILEGERP